MANLLSTIVDGQITVNSGRLLLQTGGVNTYGIISGYNNNNHFITMRGSVSGSTTSPTLSGVHQMTFVEYAEANDSTGWYFKSSSSGTYEEIARITRSGINWNGNTVIHSGNIGSQSVSYALNSTRLYASDAPYTFGGSAPYYMYMTFDGSRWLLQVTPGTPAAVRVSYADSAGSAGSASTAGYSDEAKWISYPDGPRDLSDRSPIWNNRSVAWDFVGAATANGSGNYGGVMTFVPWDGTSASTGDSSYQLAFANTTGVNASGQPKLSIRNGINSTWNAWYTLIHSGNIGSQSVSNADTVDSLHASSFVRNDTTGQYLRAYYQYGSYLTSERPIDLRNQMGGSGMRVDFMIGAGGGSWNHVITFSGYDAYNMYQLGGYYDGGSATNLYVRSEANHGTTSWTAWRRLLNEVADPYAVNMNQYVRTTDSPTFANVYATEWFRNYGNQGIYNQTYGTHFYSNAAEGFVVTGSGGIVQLQFRSNHQSTVRGYVYADTSNNIGFLNDGGSWALRMSSTRNAEIFGSDLTIGVAGANATNIIMGDNDEGGRIIHCNSNRIGFLNQSSSWGSWCYDDGSWATGVAMYSPIFYDSADNSYYGDFAGFSRMSEIGVTNDYVYNYDSIDSSRAVAEFGNVGKYVAKRSGAADYPSFSFEHTFGNHSWGQIARFHIGGSGGADRPSIQFSSAQSNDRWNIGFCTGTDNNFRISQNMGYRPDNSGTTDGWGTERFRINTDGTAYLPSTLSTNEISHANGRVSLTGNLHIDSYNGNDIYMNYYSSRGTRIYVGSGTLALHVNTDGLVYMPTVVVNSHSDNTKGYRIHNTSGTAVSAMFVNSSNALVIAAGAFEQINLNKKVLVNAVALGVNIAPSATAGRIDASNDIVAYSSSDERLKENITPIANALDKVKSLTGVEFDWKPEHKEAHGHEGHDTGIIAQQVLGVMPTAVRTNDTGYLAVRYEKLIGLLIEANKELAARVEELEKKIG